VLDGGSPVAASGEREAFRALCAAAVPEVYNFALRRCGDSALAEDVTSEALLAAATRYCEGEADSVTCAWLITVARYKLIDHWRRAEREQQRLHLVNTDDTVLPAGSDESPTGRALTVLREMAPAYQAVLTLRYLDNLSVPDVAVALDRSVHATESLLTRAKAAFRRAYLECPDE